MTQKGRAKTSARPAHDNTDSAPATGLSRADDVVTLSRLKPIPALPDSGFRPTSLGYGSPMTVTPQSGIRLFTAPARAQRSLLRAEGC
jgi:hypothetical protein